METNTSLKNSDRLDNILPQRRICFERQYTTNCLIIVDDILDVDKNGSYSEIGLIQNYVDNVYTFTNSNSCLEFIRSINNVCVSMIIRGYIAQNIVPKIHKLSHINTIFIYSNNVSNHQKWIKNWIKVKGIFTEIGTLFDEVKKKLYQYEKNSISASFIPNLTTKLDDLSPSFMYTTIIKDILMNMDFEEKHKQDYIDFCRATFIGNKKELAHIDTFESRYHENCPIWWYTYECFLYPMLNRALRTLDTDKIIKMGFFIRDLNQNIDLLYREQYSEQYNRTFLTVYRGQGLSRQDLEQMLEIKGGLFSFNNFLSTSINREVSLDFAKHAANYPDTVGILFTITIDPKQSKISFASIREVSCFDTEDEVLFSMHSVFRICGVQSIDVIGQLYEVTLTTTSDDDEELCELMYNIREDIPTCESGWRSLAIVLEKMGDFNKAEEVYLSLLKEATYALNKGSLYHAIGRVKFGKKQYREAVELHQQGINIYLEDFHEDSPNLFQMYNSLGLAYSALDENSNALSYFEKAMNIKEKLTTSDQADLAEVYQNIGIVYYKMNDWSNALLASEKALSIRQTSLPSIHPSLAITHYYLGLIFKHRNEYITASSHFKSAVHIGERTLPSYHPELAKYKQELDSLA